MSCKLIDELCWRDIEEQNGEKLTDTEKYRMHRREGYDNDVMYDVTRNMMLGQGVQIPCPDKYWTAEVLLDGCDKYSTAYMFSAKL